MAVRKIVKIDEKKCNGCGMCIPNCAEGALAIVDGKAKLVKDIYCDGLGACLGHCPQDAIEVIEREAEDFDEEAAMEFVKSKQAIKKPAGGGCPGSRMRQMNRSQQDESDVKISSKLSHWPVQLKLVPSYAPYLKEADLLITADCVPFAYANYHNDFLKGRSVVVGCPKLDDVNYYTEKLQDIIKENNLKSITVLRMEVPCCGGIAAAAKNARDRAGSNLPVQVVTIGIDGEIIKKEEI